MKNRLLAISQEQSARESTLRQKRLNRKNKRRWGDFSSGERIGPKWKVAHQTVYGQAGFFHIFRGLPQCLYGSELWGFDKGRAKAAQKVINEAAKLTLSVGGKGAGISRAALLEELGLKSAHSVASARRARALAKFGTLKSWIARLIAKPMKARRRAWMSATAMAVKRTTGRMRPDDRDGRKAYKRTLEKLKEDAACKKMRWIRRCNFSTFQRDLRDFHLSKTSAYGKLQVAKMRCIAFRFAPWLAKAGYSSGMVPWPVPCVPLPITGKSPAFPPSLWWI